MANQVFANNMEISCKAADGKSVACFPDVCFTPPQAPPTPMGVPIPYPNTGMAKDTANGSRTVKITGKEVMLKDQSYFKTSYGDEAGCAPKKGVITSRNKGKVYFTSWSMNVKFESKNVVRNMDLTTHNHASKPGNTPPWPYVDQVAVAKEEGPCKDDIKKEKAACKEFKPHGTRDACAEMKASLPFATNKPSQNKGSPEPNQLADAVSSNDCLNARRCALQPYSPNKCCSPQTPHHLIEASGLFEVGRGTQEKGKPAPIPLPGVNTGTQQYDENKAPCVCAEGTSHTGGTHGAMHTIQSIGAAKSTSTITLSNGEVVKSMTYKQSKANAIDAMGQVFPYSYCDPKCTESQLDHYHNKCGINDSTNLKAVQVGETSPEAAERISEEIAERYSSILLSKLG